VTRAQSGRFVRILLLITVVAFGVRIGYVVLEKWNEPMVGDQIFYNAAANRLSDGDGFVVPFDKKNPKKPGVDPAAEHPPLTVLVLAPVSWISGWNPNADRVAMAVLGTLGVALIGLLGRAVAGDRAGLFAAAIAAVYPNLWVNDGLVMSETLSVLAVVLALLLAYRFAQKPTAITALGLGVVCGFAALARAELILLIPLLAIPAILVNRRVARPERIQCLVIAVAAAGVIIGPWVVYNLGRFDNVTLLSTNDGGSMLGANCDAAYYGNSTGLWQKSCLPPVAGDESIANSAYREDALRYMRAHKDRIPAVVVARVGRTWSLFRPGDMRTYNEGEGREPWVTTAGLWFYYPLLLLAIAGVISLRRSLDRLWPLLVPVVTVTFISVVSYGQTRFRVPAEPSLVVLAAVAIDAFLPGGVVRRGARTRSEAVVDVLQPAPFEAAHTIR
jgi:4-amino-4-deoxy-L-arabinose transferase-like glycosyltransferase